MTVVVERRLRFEFADTWDVSRYESWGFYRDAYKNQPGGRKAVDIVAIEPGSHAWLVEATDYRWGVAQMRNVPKIGALIAETAKKFIDTVSGLDAAQTVATADDERSFARSAMSCPKRSVVLHLEQPRKPSKLYPRFFDPAVVRQELKRLVRTLDPTRESSTSTPRVTSLGP